jgi:hypothetical protein
MGGAEKARPDGKAKAGALEKKERRRRDNRTKRII